MLVVGFVAVARAAPAAARCTSAALPAMLLTAVTLTSTPMTSAPGHDVGDRRVVRRRPADRYELLLPGGERRRAEQGLTRSRRCGRDRRGRAGRRARRTSSTRSSRRRRSRRRRQPGRRRPQAHRQLAVAPRAQQRGVGHDLVRLEVDQRAGALRRSPLPNASHPTFARRFDDGDVDGDRQHVVVGAVAVRRRRTQAGRRGRRSGRRTSSSCSLVDIGLRPAGATSRFGSRVSRMRVGVSGWYSPPAPIVAFSSAATVRPASCDENEKPITVAATTSAVAVAERATTRRARRDPLTGADRNPFVMSFPDAT